MQSNTHHLFAKGLFIGLVMLALVTLSCLLHRPPAVVPADAPQAEFSAVRAAEHLPHIAAEIHPIGSPAIEQVSRYLAGQLESLGVEPVIQHVEFFDQQTQRAARLTNVMGRIPGSGDGNAVLFMGHYDSTDKSYGAADNGSAVASMLELVRLLRHHPTMINDMIVLFTDGEEVGLLGAKAFVSEHPWADDVRAVVNIESRGTAGVSLLFETSDGNLDLVSAYARAVSKPMGTSLGYEIYSRMPNDTDFSPFREAGFEGLNFAFIDNGFDYHTAGDRIEHLDLRSVQHHGTHVKGLALYLGNHSLEFSPGRNAVFFNTFGYGFAWYSYAWVLPLAVLALLCFLILVVYGSIRKLLGPLKILFGFLSYAVYLLVVYMLVHSLFLIISRGYPGADFRLLEFRIPELMVGFGGLVMAFSIVFFHLARRGVRLWHALILLFVGWALLAWSGQFSLMYAVYALLSVLALYVFLRKPSSSWNLAAGAMVVWVALNLATAILAPGVSYLFTWPLLFSLVAITLQMIPHPEKPWLWWKVLVLAAFALPALAWFPVTASLFTVAMGLEMIGFAFLLVGLMTGLLIPQLNLVTMARSWLFPTLLLAAGLVFLFRGGVGLEYDSRYQKLNSILFVTDGVQGESLWVTTNQEVDTWTAQFLTTRPDTLEWSGIVPSSTARFLAMRAESGLQDLPVTEAELISDSIYGGQRVLNLHIRSERNVHWMNIYINAGASPVRLGFHDGGPFLLQPLRQSTWHYVPYFAFPAEGIRMTLHVDPQQSVDLHLVDVVHGFPAFVDKEPRPPYKIPHGDRTLASVRYTF